MAEPGQCPIGADQPPLAEVARPRRWWRDASLAHLLLALAALLLALGLPLWAWRDTGPQIEIQFPDGHGLKAGDALRHLGIDVGRVESVKLAPGDERVLVAVRLDVAAQHLAREGSRFWIERPQISLTRMRSLDTVLGAKYVAVLPGPASGAAQYRFEGEPHPLTVGDLEAGEITVRFSEGYGLAVGDPLRHRGIVVGEVTGVDLDEALMGVEVRVRLTARAARLARAGSRFWVERPQVDLQGVRGLETLVGGRYLAVAPGPSEGEPVRQFVGLDVAPSVQHTAGGLELVLESPERQGVQAGAPVSFRGYPVGSVQAVDLSADSTKVEFRIYIEPPYRALVRQGTRFWTTSGINLNVGLSGVELTAETLATIAAGGVAFATPPDGGQRVAPGTRFPLAAKAQSEWLEWSAPLPSGPMLPNDEMALPRPVRVFLQWDESLLTFRRARQRAGLAIRWQDDTLWLPADLATAPEDAVEDSAQLSINGRTRRLAAVNARREQGLAAIDWPLPGDASPWNADRARKPGAPENCWLVIDHAPMVPVAEHQITPLPSGAWQLSPAFPVLPDWHGAAVVAVEDGALLGILLVDRRHGHGRIVPLPL